MRQHRSSTKSMDAHWSERQKRKEASKDTGPPLRTIGLPGCWCGKPFGVCPSPHPRPVVEHPPTPAQQRVAAILAIQEAGVCPVCLGKDPECHPCLGTGTFPPPKERYR